MKLSKVLISTAVAASVAGAFGLSYAQNINYKYSNNTTQTQSDAALPCQPGPFNPHLPGKDGANINMNCSTFTTTQVIVQAEAVVPEQPAPFVQPVQVAEPRVAEAPVVYNTPSNDVVAMSEEREPRADRN